jgi:lysophospholipid acyltransferase (LPLAT)-like uncharacterized protein
VLRKIVLPYLIWALYSLWIRTWRLKVVESEGMKRARREKRPLVFAFWHGDELAAISLTRFYPVATMTSTSRDGELLDRVVRLLGVKTSRGSSTRGAVHALKGLIDLAKEGRTAVVAVDGPKGPYHKVKPGIFQVAKAVEALVVPFGFHASRVYVFKKSWNKARFPLPFSKVTVVWGEAYALEEASDPRDPKLAHDLENRLAAAEQEARKLIASG